ncbi:hypothetical protein Y1Q_0016995 [Alligator mississippiensis]|uniref:Uncharacterized protein n=1 Tax=Alligator mississippiensis TaxID=8496 RepID=A0A151N376_ALLMI|nr:hypothetical protein Y1Q_0016995 [Alligator mississippiensis]
MPGPQHGATHVATPREPAQGSCWRKEARHQILPRKDQLNQMVLPQVSSTQIWECLGWNSSEQTRQMTFYCRSDPWSGAIAVMTDPAAQTLIEQPSRRNALKLYN